MGSDASLARLADRLGRPSNRLAEVTVKVVEITPEAEITISEMRQRCTEIGNTLGFAAQEYLDAIESLAACLMTILRLGGRISKDGDLNLYGVSFIHYGVIFHSKHDDPLIGVWSVHS